MIRRREQRDAEMLGSVVKLSKTVLGRFGLQDHAARARRARADLCSMKDYEETFRELFLTVEDSDPLYRHKRNRHDGYYANGK